MRYTVLIIQMIQLPRTSYMMAAINNHVLQSELAVRSLIILVALKFITLKDIVLLLMIQYFVSLLEISVMQKVL
jgi:hypothetical protein